MADLTALRVGVCVWVHGCQSALCGASSASALEPGAFRVGVRVSDRKRFCFKDGWEGGWGRCMGEWVPRAQCLVLAVEGA